MDAEPASEPATARLDCEEVADTPAPGRSPRRAAKSVAVMVVLTVAGLLRSTNAGQRFGLWGEDGQVFAQEARSYGVLRSFFRPYAGYFHFLPRTVGAFASVLPLRWTSVVFVMAAAVITAACTWLSWSFAGKMGLSVPAAALVAAAVFLLPGGGFEVVNNPTNSQWCVLATVLVFVAAWIAGYQPPLAGGVVLLLVAGLSSPLIGVALPVVAVVALRRRRRVDFAVLSALTLSTAVQFGSALLHRSSTSRSTFGAARLAHVYALRVVGGSLVGDRFLYAYSLLFTAPAMAVIAALILVLLVVTLLPPGRVRVPAAFLLAESLVLFTAPIFLRRDYLGTSSTAFGEFGGVHTVILGRYMAVPAFALFASAVVALDGRYPNLRSEVSRLATLATLMAAVVVLVASYPIQTQRRPLSSWTADVEAAAQACREHRQSTVAVSNAPSGGWGIYLTCRQAFP